MYDLTSVGEENETPFIRVWKPFSSICAGEAEMENPKRTISAYGGLGLLQMVSKLRRCASKDASSLWGVDFAGVRKERVSTRTLGPEGVGL